MLSVPRSKMSRQGPRLHEFMFCYQLLSLIKAFDNMRKNRIRVVSIKAERLELGADLDVRNWRGIKNIVC